MPKITTLIVESNNRLLKISLAVILVIVLLLLGLNYFGLIDLSKFLPFLPKKSPAPTVQLIQPFSLDSCNITQKNNPLVSKLSTSDVSLTGEITGVVQKIVKEPVRDATIISLNSIDQTQQYDFGLFEQPNLVFDMNTNKTASLSAIKVNQTLVLTFSCDKSSNLFKFTRVTIEK